MITRNQIESILKINDLSPTASDEEIRSVLLSASFDKDEVDSAVMILRKNTVTNKTRIDGLHKVFRTDNALTPSEVSSLLGIDIDSSHFNQNNSQKNAGTVSIVNYILVIILSIVVAVVAVLFLMYSLKAGPFHPTIYP